jgi:hypothetical protein
MVESDESADLAKKNLGLKDILQLILATLEDVGPAIEVSSAAKDTLMVSFPGSFD